MEFIINAILESIKQKDFTFILITVFVTLVVYSLMHVKFITEIITSRRPKKIARLIEITSDDSFDPIAKKYYIDELQRERFRSIYGINIKTEVRNKILNYYETVKHKDINFYTLLRSHINMQFDGDKPYIKIHLLERLGYMYLGVVTLFFFFMSVISYFSPMLLDLNKFESFLLYGVGIILFLGGLFMSLAFRDIASVFIIRRFLKKQEKEKIQKNCDTTSESGAVIEE